MRPAANLLCQLLIVAGIATAGAASAETIVVPGTRLTIDRLPGLVAEGDGSLPMFSRRSGGLFISIVERPLETFEAAVEQLSPQVLAKRGFSDIKRQDSTEGSEVVAAAKVTAGVKPREQVLLIRKLDDDIFIEVIAEFDAAKAADGVIARSEVVALLSSIRKVPQWRPAFIINNGGRFHRVAVTDRSARLLLDVRLPPSDFNIPFIDVVKGAPAAEPPIDLEGSARARFGIDPPFSPKALASTTIRSVAGRRAYQFIGTVENAVTGDVYFRAEVITPMTSGDISATLTSRLEDGSLYLPELLALVAGLTLGD